MNNANNKTRQYMLHFVPQTDFSEENFMVTSCNETAYRGIKIWPYWQHFALSIFGPKSSGKTHLAHIWRERVQKSLPRPVQIPILAAHNINMKNVNKLANEHQYLIIDNITANINEEAFFHLYNFFNVPERYVLMISEQPLSKLQLKLPDLRSRLNIVPGIEIKQPTDEMLTALIAKLFNDRQIIINQDILEYILQNTERSFDFISRLVGEIDELSWTYHRAVSVQIVKEALKNLTQNQQLELFI